MALKKNPYQILCIKCRAFLFFYHGEFEGRFDWENFKPSHAGVPLPQPKGKMRCPECGEPWYMINLRGSPIMMTNRGWKPREPDGPNRIFLPGEQTLTASFQPDTEFQEPMA